MIRGSKIVTQQYGPVVGGGGQRYLVDTVHLHDGPLVLGSSGLHFSSQPLWCVVHLGKLPDGFRLLEVEADAADTVENRNENLYATRRLRIVREVALPSPLLTDVVRRREMFQYENGVLHQADDNVPAYVSGMAGGDSDGDNDEDRDVRAAWFQHGVPGRCDEADLPVRASRIKGTVVYEWLNADGQLHRDDKPAYLSFSDDGRQATAAWFVNGQRVHGRRTWTASDGSLHHIVDGPRLAKICHTGSTVTLQYVSEPHDILEITVRDGSNDVTVIERFMERKATLQRPDDGRIVDGARVLTKPHAAFLRSMLVPTFDQAVDWIAGYRPDVDVLAFTSQ
jgi:hypothetical protein